MTDTNNVNVNKKYKDSLFKFLFGTDKARALELYNAVNGSKYTNVDDLEINTLQDVIYMKMKNDVSFIFGRELNLYEHQSSVNPNMPLRGLMYISELYNQIYGHDPRIYSSRLLRIPLPRYYVFYNGNTDSWNEETFKLRLSNMFDKLPNADEIGDFEWTATVVNINHGKHAEMKNRSETLHGYCRFIDMVKEYKETEILSKAIDLAIQRCIDEDILSDFLIKHRSEVKNMCLTEFDQDAYTEMIREEAREEAHEKDTEITVQAIHMKENGITDVEEYDKIGCSRTIYYALFPQMKP